MTVAFIIRFHYKKDDPRFEWRFNYFKKYVLTNILAQTFQGFDICIWVNEWHRHYFEELNVPNIKLFTVKGENVRYKQNNGKRYFVDFVKWNQVQGLEKYDVQLGLDSDDLITDQYLAIVMATIEKNKDAKSLHVSFQPMLHDVATGNQKPMPQVYNSLKGSAFFALYQPDKEKYIFAYQDSHLRLGRYCEKSITIPAGYCYASCHEFNESTRI